jgi:hypothetical protein
MVLRRQNQLIVKSQPGCAKLLEITGVCRDLHAIDETFHPGDRTFVCESNRDADRVSFDHFAHRE